MAWPMNRAHYQPAVFDKKLMLKILENVVQSETSFYDGTACWDWQRCTTALGYGRIWYNKKMRWLHRMAYAVFVGEIPESMTIDHKCLNRRCCNPKHLEPVTQSENSIRRQQQHANC